MSQKSPASDYKKRKLNSPRESPLISLNVGGTKRDVPRSILNKLRDASCVTPASVGAAGGGGEAMNEGSGNPLCDLILMGADHWSDVPTMSDSDGNVRIYIDRNPQAFDDLLAYIEHGTIFLKNLLCKDESGSRLDLLRMECDYFTVEALSKDVDEVMYGKAVSFRSDDWFSVQAQFVRNREGDVVMWVWGKIHENKSIAIRGGNGRPSICDVTSSGTYLMFLSFHTIAVTALQPGSYYPKDGDDECAQVSIFRDEMTENYVSMTCSNWTYPLVRCGAFDYRTDRNDRKAHPYLFTAAVAEPVSLSQGNQLYLTHGRGAIHSSSRTTNAISKYSPFDEEEHHCTNFLTLIRIFGDSFCKWNVKGVNGEDGECVRVAKWVPATDDLPKTNQGTYLDENDATKIRFRKCGYYLLLGRIAARLEKNRTGSFQHKGSIQLDHRTNGGKPLQIFSEVVSFWTDSEEPSYNKKLAEYGPINDIIYAQSDSYIRVRATEEACFAQHGTAPGPTDEKVPTQSLSAMRLDDMKVDRYRLYAHGGESAYTRALGGKESETNCAPLFSIKRAEGAYYAKLEALEDFQCIIIGCVSCLIGNVISLCKNEEAVVNSQICKGDGHGYGAHTLNTVVDIKAGDLIFVDPQPIPASARGPARDPTYDVVGGHLAFLVIE